MARHALSEACLTLVRCLERVVPPALAAQGSDHCRIGLSGGADSLALTAAAAWARDHRSSSPLAGLPIRARIVDHGLQTGSAAVAAQAARQAEALGIEAEVVRVEVTADGRGVEAAARTARHAALTDDPGAVVLLAHTLDDQAETVLLGLARGSGTRSLSGMAPQRGRLVRPFLTVRRRETEQACRDWGLTWWEDPANRDPAYTRSRLRTAMDLLDRTLGPGLAGNLARTADLCREDADLLDDWADRLPLDPGQPVVALTELAGLPAPIRRRFLLAWLRVDGQDAVTRDHVLAVDRLISDWHGQKAVDVPGARVVRAEGELRRQAVAA